MTQLTMEQRVIAAMARALEIPAGLLTPATLLSRGLDADELDRIEIEVELEDEFGTTFPLTGFLSLDMSVAEVIGAVRQALQQAEGERPGVGTDRHAWGVLKA